METWIICGEKRVQWIHSESSENVAPVWGPTESNQYQSHGRIRVLFGRGLIFEQALRFIRNLMILNRNGFILVVFRRISVVYDRHVSK